MESGNYAVMENDEYLVLNTIFVQDKISIKGKYLVFIAEGVSCGIGNFYNPKDGLFYLDGEYNVVSGTPLEVKIDLAG